MSASNREAGEHLRRRYANHFGVSLGEVTLVEIEDDGLRGERCAVMAEGHPVWTTSGPAPEWMRSER